MEASSKGGQGLEGAIAPWMDRWMDGWTHVKVRLFYLLKIGLFKLKQFTLINGCSSLNFLLGV
jgi:hypothetical protein